MTGLTDIEVEKNRKKYGSDSLNKKKSNSFIKLLINSLGDPIIKILVIALAIKTIFLFKNFDWYETIGIVLSILKPIIHRFSHFVKLHFLSCILQGMSISESMKCASTAAAPGAPGPTTAPLPPTCRRRCRFPGRDNRRRTDIDATR